MDALSEVLKVVRLSGAMYFNAEASAPWRVRSPPASRIGPMLSGRSDDRVITYHLVSGGRGYVSVGDETVGFAAGDLIVFPHGDAHIMGHGLDAPLIESDEQLAALLSRRLQLSRFGGGGEVTRLVCGYFCCEPRLTEPLLGGLPRVLKLNLREEESGGWLEASIHHAVAQAAAAAPGSDLLLARLSEVLFTETLRRYAAHLPAQRTGWLAGSRDPLVGRCLAVLHNQPERDWTLESLARELGASRSVLTERFARFLGTSPMAYLAEWRLELGADRLRTSSRSVLQIATSVGYDSEAAFNRAFKRRFGLPPARYRRSARLARRDTAETASLAQGAAS